MNSTAKGNSLEDAFHQYLLDQQGRGDLIFDLYAPENCKIYKKKAYYCREREAEVEFDIVIEVYQTGRDTPHFYAVFECKNHGGSIPEIYVNDFSNKLDRIFPCAAKGVIVITSRLQAGAERVARNSRMGIVKYVDNGLEIIADRKGSCVEYGFLRAQILQHNVAAKDLKFSAYHEGKYFSELGDFINDLISNNDNPTRYEKERFFITIPFLSQGKIKKLAKQLLEMNKYESGAVDLSAICRCLDINLKFTKNLEFDADRVPILGSAHFERKIIQINSNSRETRERFTIGHEIGHFYLGHERYLRSEMIIERDLFVTREKDGSFNYERLEYQANAFAAELLMPDATFLRMTARFRKELGMRNRGYGYIFVDDQPLNLGLYELLISHLSSYFEVSKRAVEVKLRKANLLTDRRTPHGHSSISAVFSGLKFL